MFLMSLTKFKKKTHTPINFKKSVHFVIWKFLNSCFHISSRIVFNTVASFEKIIIKSQLTWFVLFTNCTYNQSVHDTGIISSFQTKICFLQFFFDNFFLIIFFLSMTFIHVDQYIEAIIFPKISSLTHGDFFFFLKFMWFTSHR